MLFENQQSKKSSSKTVIAILTTSFFLITSSEQTKAQTSIKLNAAIDSVLQNNSEIKSATLQAFYQKKLIGSSIDIANTSINGQYGQYNSFYNDNSFSINQSFKFPTVYSKQKLLQKTIYEESKSTVTLKEALIKKEISDTYYQLVYLDLQHQLLKEADSLFSNVNQKSKLRYETGETDLVQYKDIELQKSQIGFQLKDLELKQLELMGKFNLLIQTKEKYIPDYADVTNIIVFAEIKSAIENHPQLNTLKQQLQIAQSKTKLEQHSLLPELHFGYYSTTIRGTGADNLIYGGGSRFNSLQFGIGLPLFFNTQQGKIRAARVQELIYQEQYDYEKQALSIQIENAIARYKSTYEKVNYYQTALLTDNNLMIDKATKKFELGEINYLEWAMLMQHAIQTKTNYTDAVYELNLCINELNYLTSK